MYEVEVKVRADLDAVRARLATLGAEHEGWVDQRDVYYDAPHCEFAETDEALRVRHESVPVDGGADGSATTRLTYKGPLVESASKTREEHETAVVDPDALAGVLEGLGFRPAATVEKERERYRVDDYTVTLDRVAGLGEFVEVERGADADGVDAAREGAFAVLRDLDLDPDDQLRTSYLGLLADEGDVSE